MKTPTQVIMKPKRQAQMAADIINHIADDPNELRRMWDALDEPAREQMLTYFAEWDKEFCEALNPKPA